MQLEIVIENGQAFVLIGKQRVPCDLGLGYVGLADGTYELKNAVPIPNGGAPVSDKVCRIDLVMEFDSLSPKVEYDPWEIYNGVIPIAPPREIEPHLEPRCIMPRTLFPNVPDPSVWDHEILRDSIEDIRQFPQFDYLTFLLPQGLKTKVREVQEEPVTHQIPIPPKTLFCKTIYHELVSLQKDKL